MDANRPTRDASLDAVGMVAAGFTLAAWSTAPILIKFFADHIDVWTSNGWRYAFGAAVWLPVLLVLLARRRLPAGIWRAALVPAAFNTAGQVAFVAAFYQVGAAMVTFGLRVHIVFVALGAALLFPAERALVRSRPFILSAAMVLLGTGMVALLHPDLLGARAADPANPAGSPASASAARTWLGVALAVAAGVGFAGYALAVRRCMAGVHPIASFAVISQYTAAAMLALMLAAGRDAGAGALDLSLPLFGLLILSAIIAIAIGHVAYYTGISRLGVSLTAGVVQLQPFCVAAISIPVLGERMSWGQWVGGGVAVAGALAMLAAQRRLHARRAAASSVEPKPGPDDGALDDLPPDAVVGAVAAAREPAPQRPEPTKSELGA